MQISLVWQIQKYELAFIGETIGYNYKISVFRTIRYFI